MRSALQAAQEKKAEVKEASQAAAPPPAPGAGSPPQKPPARNSVSSIHVNYDYFAVGTGQVKAARLRFVFLR